ncbi:MAG: hypothetical protein L6W00_20610 [Lentisphaeria bacterium]|nr:MAG: hypothetical protein L6W00_20610 [Lentisphaeria bacterium]
MKKTMILTTLIAGILLGTICSGCGESDETKANIKAIAEAQKAQAAAAARTEAEKAAQDRRGLRVPFETDGNSAPAPLPAGSEPVCA